MRKPRLYHSEALSMNSVITLQPNAHMHVIKVLRMREGDELILFNGSAKDYLATITSVNTKTTVSITQEIDETLESPLYLHLGQGLARGDRMDYIVQKATELGVNRITPLLTDTSMIKLDEKRAQKKLQHWQNIIISACEQCGRNVLPTIDLPTPFQKFVVLPFDGKKVLFHPGAQQGITKLAKQAEPLQLLIGPESGLSDSECRYAMESGFQDYRLGPRILRTETASVTALSILQALNGDID